MKVEEVFVKDSYFKIDVEAHLIGDISDIDYFPGVQKLMSATGRMRHWLGTPKLPAEQLPKQPTEEENLLYFMDHYGVDMACVLPESFMDSTGYATRWSTNGYIARVCEKYPERFIFQANVGPMIRRGIENAIWEAEYLVKERNCRILKFFPPGDTFINDPELWPFYKKVCELGVPVSIHTGVAWAPPGLSKHSHPMLLEEVANAFPEMKIIAFHNGWPYCTELNIVAGKYKNIYVSWSNLLTWCNTAPRRAAHIIGEALQFLRADRIIWGTDFAVVPPQMRYSIEGFRDFEIPKDMREGYDYPNLTEEDKKKIFGLNLAKLLRIEPVKRA